MARTGSAAAAFAGEPAADTGAGKSRPAAAQTNATLAARASAPRCAARALASGLAGPSCELRIGALMPARLASPGGDSKRAPIVDRVRAVRVPRVAPEEQRLWFIGV